MMASGWPWIHSKLELAKHISLHTNGEPLLKRSSSYSQSPPVSGLPMAMVVLFQGKFQGQFDTYRLVCNRNCVILQRKRARCTLNKEILDLLNRKAFLERAVVELVYKFDVTYIHHNIDTTNTDHITPARACARGVNICTLYSFSHLKRKYYHEYWAKWHY